MKRFLLNDKSILLLIIINSVIIFLLGFKFDNPLNYTLTIFDGIISTLFILEVIVKIREYGFSGYFSEAWNKFDFILVFISIPSLLILIFGLDFIDVSFLLIFRTLRVFKVFRFFRFIKNIDRLLSGIRNALKSSILILVSFILYIFIVGILSHSLFGYSELFSNPGTSIYSVLKIFTLEGWYEFPDALSVGASAFTTFLIRMYFILILLSGGVFGLSLVNSIFIDAMISNNNVELEGKVDNLTKMVKELVEQNKIDSLNK